jgi:hypothetical protein
MTTESTMRRTGDTILKWALSLVGAGIIAAIALLIDIRVSLATYQADAKAMKEQINEIKVWQIRHDDQDRAMFQALAKGGK